MTLQFADFVIDTERYELRRNGEPVAVEPLVFDLLRHLASHPHTLFSRDELMASVWQGRIVSDTTVAGCIKAARRALGDSGTEQRFIQTVHGRGFRFIGQVLQTPEPDFSIATPPAEAPRFTPPSLLILPYRCLNGPPALAQFAAGLEASLGTVLTRIPLLHINTQGGRYAGSDPPPTARALHEQTGAHFVLEGSLQLLGKNLRITSQLTNAVSGFQSWAGHCELAAAGIDSRLDEGVTAIIAKLEPQLNRAIYERVRSNALQPTAQELYLQASSLLALRGWHRDTFTQAADLLRRSAEAEPDFALAPAYLALVLALGHRVGLLVDREQTRREAVSRAERALELDSLDSTVLGFSGCALADLGQPDRALPILRQAVELNPANAQAWAALGSAWLIKGDLSRAVEHLTRGICNSPLDSRLAVWESLLALALLSRGDLEAAEGRAEHACQSDDRTHMARVVLAAVRFARGQSEAARQALMDAYRIKPDLSAQEIDALVTAPVGQRLRALCD